MPNSKKISGAGLGLRRHFIKEIAQTLPAQINWLECAPENYIDLGGKNLEDFKIIANHYPLVAHSLSLSIGSTDELNWDYLKKIKDFIREYNVPWLSDHFCFSQFKGHYSHDLLPLPLTLSMAKHVAERARKIQDFLEVPFGLENISFYAHPAQPQMSELEFIGYVLDKAKISLMLDINNVYVNGINHKFNPHDYLEKIASWPILQIHMAGHDRLNKKLIIDTHGEPIINEVWDLLEFFSSKRKLPPVVIERDFNFPPLSELLDEVSRAQDIIDQGSKIEAASPIYLKISDEITTNEIKSIEDFYFDVLFKRNVPESTPEIFLKYRSFVENRISAYLKKIYDGFFSLLSEPETSQLIRDYLEFFGPKTPYFRKLPQDFFDFFNNESLEIENEKPYLKDVLDFEYCLFTLAGMRGVKVKLNLQDAELENLVPIVNDNLFLKNYEYRVTDINHGSIPEKIKTPMVLWRHPKTLEVQHEITSEMDLMAIQHFLNNKGHKLKDLCSTSHFDETNFIQFLQMMIKNGLVIALS